MFAGDANQCDIRVGMVIEAENSAGYAPENELPQPRMAVAAHDQEIRRVVRGMRQDGAGDVGLGGNDALELHFRPMAREMVGHVGPRQLIALGGSLATTTISTALARRMNGMASAAARAALRLPSQHSMR